MNRALGLPATDDEKKAEKVKIEAREREDLALIASMEQWCINNPTKNKMPTPRQNEVFFCDNGKLINWTINQNLSFRQINNGTIIRAECFQ